MNLILGSAVSISAEVDSAIVADTQIVLFSLIDPDGTELASNESLEYGEDDESNIATVVWQSTSANIVGKYNFILRATNGINTGFAKGSFYLEEQ